MPTRADTSSAVARDADLRVWVTQQNSAKQVTPTAGTVLTWGSSELPWRRTQSMHVIVREWSRWQETIATCFSTLRARRLGLWGIEPSVDGGPVA
jgi:hypothetical protein